MKVLKKEVYLVLKMENKMADQREENLAELLVASMESGMADQ